MNETCLVETREMAVMKPSSSVVRGANDGRFVTLQSQNYTPVGSSDLHIAPMPPISSRILSMIL